MPAQYRVGLQMPGTWGAGSRNQAGCHGVLMRIVCTTWGSCGHQPQPAPGTAQPGSQLFLCPPFSSLILAQAPLVLPLLVQPPDLSTPSWLSSAGEILVKPKCDPRLSLEGRCRHLVILIRSNLSWSKELGLWPRPPRFKSCLYPPVACQEILVTLPLHASVSPPITQG